MAKKKLEQEDERIDQGLKRSLLKSRLPLLILDERYYKLFPEEKKTDRIRVLERRLNDLMKGQGKLNTDMEDLRKLKKKLMEEVISNMGESTRDTAKMQQKKQEKLQEMIIEINEKLADGDSALENRPKEITEANIDLLMECMRVWYRRLDENNSNIMEASLWIEQVREELKQKLLVKQDLEMENERIYSYMHTLLGRELMEKLDSKYEKKYREP